MAVCSADEIAQLRNLIQAALNAGNIIEALRLTGDLIECLNGSDDETDKGTLPGGRNTTNPILAPVQPHGDQNRQRSFWNITGNPCGRCPIVPRYWRLSFNFSVPYPEQTFENQFGNSFTDSAGAPYFDYRNWFEAIDYPGVPGQLILKRGKMARRAPEGLGSFGEAIAARAELEYDYCFWKRRVRLDNELLDLHSVNRLNVAWFIHYEGNAPNVSSDSNAEGGWRLSVIENTFTKATSEGGTTWNNSYSPLLKYQLVPPNRQPYEPDPPVEGVPPQKTFKCLGKRNVFEVIENNLSLPLHIAYLEPFWP